MKTKQLTINGKKLKAFKMSSEEFLQKIQKSADTKKGQYCLLYNNQIVYVFDTFFVWRKTNEFVCLHNDVLIKTKLFVGKGLKEKDLLKWKNKTLGEKNEGRKQACSIQSSKKNGVSNKSKTKNTGGKSKSTRKSTSKVKKVSRNTK